MASLAASGGRHPLLGGMREALPSRNAIPGCRSCGGKDLSTFLSLGDMPLSDGLLAPQDL